MRPKTLSASGAQVFEGCAARFKAEYIDRARDASGEAAELGTTCHKALELIVKRSMTIGHATEDDIKKIYEEAFDSCGLTDKKRHDEGWKMVLNWWNRTNLDDVEVLSTEKFERFDLKLPSGITIPWVYVIDRLDKTGDKAYRVVDYKTVMVPVQPEELHDRIQGRAYALAVQIMFPDAEEIWVEFDLLRYEVAAAKFTKADNIETWNYLRRMGERVLKASGSEETLNGDCRYCIRRHQCATLAKHLVAGGPLSITDPAEAADRWAQYHSATKALEKMMEDLEPVILTHCEEEGIFTFDTETNVVKVGASSRRNVVPAKVAALIGPDLMAKYGAMNIGTVDEILKGTEITDEQKSALKQLIFPKIGSPTIKVAPKKGK